MAEHRTCTCAHCGAVFQTERSDAAAREEARARFGPRVFEEPVEIVCDDCYRDILAWLAQQDEHVVPRPS